MERLRKEIASLQADEALKEEEKADLVKRFETALTQLEAAIHFEREVRDLADEAKRAPEETQALKKQLEARISQARAEGGGASEAVLPPDATAEMIDARLASEQTLVSELSRQLREIESELAQFETRPVTNRDRIAVVTRQLAEAEGAAKTTVENPVTWQEKTADALSRSRSRQLNGELARLEQEALVAEVLRNREVVRKDLVSLDLEKAKERVELLGKRSGELVVARISEAENTIGKLGEGAAAKAPEIQALVEETRALAAKNQAVLADLSKADAELVEVGEELERFRRESEGIRAQVEIGGLEDSFAEIVVDLRRSLPTSESLRAEMEKRRRNLANARLEAFRSLRELDAMPSIEGQVEEILERLRSGGAGEEEISALRPAVKDLLLNRGRLKEAFIDGNRRLAGVLAEIDLATSETLAVAGELRDFLGERLVWVASSPPLGLNAFTGLGTSFRELAGPRALGEYGGAISRISAVEWISVILLAAALLLPRKRLRRFLVDSAARTRRISFDSLGNTFAAVAASLWLALPLPTLLAFFGWMISTDSEGNGNSFALGKALMAPAILLLVLRFSAVICWPGGVADAHFRWGREIREALHRALMSLIFLYLPAQLLLTIWWFNGGDLAAFQGPGRLVFIVAMISLSLILRSFVRTRGGILAQLGESGSLFMKLRRVWTTVIILVPLGLAVFAGLGHFLTAVALAYLMQKTAFVVFGGVFVYALLTRWAILKARRLALAEVIAQREARRAAQEAEKDGEPLEKSAPTGGEGLPVQHEEEEAVNWTMVGEQTRHLIRAVVALLVVFGCWIAWSEALPALKYLDNGNLVGEISLGDLIRLSLIGLITWMLFQNLPGLLELVFLRALELDAGVRNAVVTLCQYTVIAAGFAIAFQAVGLDWSKFGWIAAALSVGLGFGLQEVVANFVSGIILLFERPIRVGDIVTVGGVDGVVSKIRIRATTITNWDKKEFIVPNKEFITGTIMNWTLSSTVTRLVFPVGIAYGSDVEKAREILLEIARSQPEVLKEPAPVAVFEQFADSSLNFTLRCFVASTDQRLDMTHRVNALIYERFAEAGIMIPFPQREIRLVSTGKTEEPPGK